MKILIKLLIFFSITSIFLTSAIGSYAESNMTPKEQIAVEKLIEYGIIKNYNPSYNVTRGDMAEYIAIFRGLARAADGMQSSSFTDVPQGYPQIGFIEIVNKAGIISGFGDKTFRPDELITFEQAVKMIVSALGYDPKAASIGGYPIGYITIALQEGISTGLTKAISDNLTQKDVVKMLYNALACPLMEQIGFLIGQSEYAVFEYKTPETSLLREGNIFLLNDKNYVVADVKDIISVEGSDEYIEFVLTEKGAERINNSSNLKLIFNYLLYNCKISINDSTLKVIPVMDQQIEEYVSEYLEKE